MNDMKNLIFKLRQNTISPFNLNEVADLIEAQAAQIERLHHALCEIAGSKSLTATPTQFYQHLQRIASDATITPPHLDMVAKVPE